VPSYRSSIESLIWVLSKGVVLIPKGIKPINSHMLYDWMDAVSTEKRSSFAKAKHLTIFLSRIETIGQFVERDG
jgi:hypothetical protein